MKNNLYILLSDFMKSKKAIKIGLYLKLILKEVKFAKPNPS